MSRRKCPDCDKWVQKQKTKILVKIPYCFPCYYKLKVISNVSNIDDEEDNEEQNQAVTIGNGHSITAAANTNNRTFEIENNNNPTDEQCFLKASFCIENNIDINLHPMDEEYFWIPNSDTENNLIADTDNNDTALATTFREPREKKIKLSFRRFRKTSNQ